MKAGKLSHKIADSQTGCKSFDRFARAYEYNFFCKVDDITHTIFEFRKCSKQILKEDCHTES